MLHVTAHTQDWPFNQLDSWSAHSSAFAVTWNTLAITAMYDVGLSIKHSCLAWIGGSRRCVVVTPRVYCHVRRLCSWLLTGRGTLSHLQHVIVMTTVLSQQLVIALICFDSQREFTHSCCCWAEAPLAVHASLHASSNRISRWKS